MTLEEYVEEYSCAPYDLYEFAEIATKLTDCPELFEAGRAYLAARVRLTATLLKYGIEQG